MSDRTVLSVINNVFEREAWEDICYDMVYSDNLQICDEILEKHYSLTDILKIFLKNQHLYENIVMKDRMEKLRDDKIEEYNECISAYKNKIREVVHLKAAAEGADGWIHVGRKRSLNKSV
jgi:hypothetical protein